MSSSLQQLSKSALVITVTALTLVSAYELSASPPEIVLQLNANIEVCRDISISSSSQSSLLLETLWSPKKSRTISDFTLTPEELDLKLRISVRNEKAHICINSPDSNAYYGVILINNPTYGTTLGIWLTLNPSASPKQIQNKVQAEITPAKITGNVITSNTSSTPHYALLVGLCTALLLAALLIWIYKKSKDNKCYAP